MFINKLHNFICFELDNVYDAVCVSFVNSCCIFGISLAQFSISMYFGSFSIFVFVKRMGVNQKLFKTIEVKP